jgi:hypothetical protein
LPSSDRASNSVRLNCNLSSLAEHDDDLLPPVP